MRRWAGWLAASGALGLALLGLGAQAWGADPHRGYRALAPDVYHPTFFPRFAAARAAAADWVRSAPEVARAYVGASRLCPEQTVRPLQVGAVSAVIVVERRCPYSAYSAATRQEFRVELELQAGAWELRWAGLRMICGLNQSWVGAWLLEHNWFRTVRAAWAAPLAGAVVALANRLNPWVTDCL